MKDKNENRKWPVWLIVPRTHSPPNKTKSKERSLYTGARKLRVSRENYSSITVYNDTLYNEGRTFTYPGGMEVWIWRRWVFFASKVGVWSCFLTFEGSEVVVFYYTSMLDVLVYYSWVGQSFRWYCFTRQVGEAVFSSKTIPSMPTPTPFNNLQCACVTFLLTVNRYNILQPDNIITIERIQYTTTS